MFIGYNSVFGYFMNDYTQKKKKKKKESHFKDDTHIRMTFWLLSVRGICVTF